ncbi:hypothetical protein [Methanosarcina siciliae]|uniref:hypothetical protein n=1 Tax=Methanosarcina siciliae TaxID=38027 RepID=UPI000AD3A23E|nr:hypothetical protein [Methanosarcina siciliae]
MWDKLKDPFKRPSRTLQDWYMISKDFYFLGRQFNTVFVVAYLWLLSLLLALLL